MPPTTTKSAIGRLGRKILPSTSSARAASPSTSAAACVSPMCAMKYRDRSQKSPWLPEMPKSFGSWVLARTRATPALKPTSTVSETKLTTEPPSSAHTTKARNATSKAVQAASAATRAASPFPTSPSVAPIRSEIAEVTVIAVCREPEKSQYTRPENRQA